MADTAAAASTCDRCQRDVRGGLAFVLKAPGGSTVKCFKCSLLHKPMLKRSLIAAAVVGTIILTINQGDLILTGHWSASFYWKIPLTYLTPFVVVTFGALSNGRR